MAPTARRYVLDDAAGSRLQVLPRRVMLSSVCVCVVGVGDADIVYLFGADSCSVQRLKDQDDH